MSHSLYFYRVSKIGEDLPEIINTDRMSFPYYDVRVEDVADWEEEIGILRTIEYSTVDMFAVGEKLFGKKPQSIRPSHSYYDDPSGPFAEVELFFPDGEKQRVHKSEMEKYRGNKQYRAYIYNRDELARVEEGYLLESKAYEDRPLSREDLLEMAKQYLDEHRDDYDSYSGYAVPIFEIMKVYFAVDEGDSIVCISD
jgi:hypothetical protein